MSGSTPLTYKPSKPVQGLVILSNVWPLVIGVLLAGFLAWAAMHWTVAFYFWQRNFALFLALATAVCCALFLGVWPNPNAFSLKISGALFRRARRFWVAILMLQLGIGAVIHLMLWGLVWLIGPRVWLLALVVIAQTVSLIGLMGWWLRKLPASLVLCWDEHLNPGFDLQTWRQEFMLGYRHKKVLIADLAKEDPAILAIVRVLEHGDGDGFSGQQSEWDKARWLLAFTTRIRASVFMAAILVPTTLAVFLLILGSLGFTAFPPGYLQGERRWMAALDQPQSHDDANLGNQESAHAANPDDHNAGGKKGDSDKADADGAASVKGTQTDSHNDGEQAKGQASSDDLESAEQPGSNQNRSTDETYTEEDVAQDNQSVSNDENRSDGDQPEKSQDRLEPPVPRLPGLNPGEQASEGDGRQGQPKLDQPRQGQGKPDQQGGQKPSPGSGQASSKADQPKSGDGSGQGSANPSPSEDKSPAGSNSKSTGSKADPSQADWGGGGGPLSGKPGPPSPPDPQVQDLIKIELPPVEAGKLKRKALAEETGNNRRKAQTTQRDGTGRRSDEAFTEAESEQVLPNWILLMLKQKDTDKRSQPH